MDILHNSSAWDVCEVASKLQAKMAQLKQTVAAVKAKAKKAEAEVSKHKKGFKSFRGKNPQDPLSVEYKQAWLSKNPKLMAELQAKWEEQYANAEVLSGFTRNTAAWLPFKFWQPLFGGLNREL